MKNKKKISDLNNRKLKQIQRQEFPRWTKEQKKNMLEFLNGDKESFRMGCMMIDNYLMIWIKEKKFNERYKKLRKSKKYISYT